MRSILVTRPIAIAALVAAAAACSSGPPTADDIIDRARAAMSSLDSCQWQTTYSNIAEPLFGGAVETGTFTGEGAWRSDGRARASRGDFVTFKTIDGVSIAHDPSGVTVLPGPGCNANSSPLNVVGDRDWTLVRTQELDGVKAYVLADGPSPEYPDVPGEETRTVLYVDAGTFLVLRCTKESRTTRRPEISPSYETHQSQTWNTLLFAHNEPVVIEFPEGFDPDG